MSEAEVYYRVHSMSVPFDAEHAWSYMVGPLDGQVGVEECHTCWGKGEAEGPDGFGTCWKCGGECTVEADRGYSCWASAAEMIEYGNDRLDTSTTRVMEFEGEQVGTGSDDEPLVVPSRVVRVMTWAEFTAENA